MPTRQEAAMKHCHVPILPAHQLWPVIEL